MSCTPVPTQTLYGTLTSFSPSTSYSQSAANAPQVTTVVQQSCVALGTINGSSVGCISTSQVVQMNTLGGGGQDVQIPIVVTIPVAEAQPTQTLFAPCSGESSSSPQSFVQPSTDIPLTTSVLVQSTFPPSTVVESSSTTLPDGSVVQTVVTLVTTLPPTSIYLPTSIANPSSPPLLQNGSSPGSGTNVAPIVGGVLGGFLGLIAIVGSLWWLCRRRRSWDDLFDKEEIQNEDAWHPPTHRERDSRKLGLNTEPKPYQYGLVGHVVPPAAAGEPTRSSQYGSVSEHSGTHSRQTSLSATPLLHATRSSRPSTAGSAQTVQTNSGARAPTETEPRSLSMASPPLPGGPSTPALLSNWTPNTDDLVVLEPAGRSGSPVPSTERRILQIVNDSPSSPVESIPSPSARRTSSVRSSNVIVHTDAGRVPESDPPAYSR